MRLLGGLLAVVGACYSPTYRDCEVTCAGGVCPSGYRCEDGMCRAPGFGGACGQMISDGPAPDIANPNNDDDGDTIKNVDDNCPQKANTNQANEDGDMRGDVCDPCPISPTSDGDGDGDGVGDGCDPDPTLTNRIELFEGFADPASPSLLAANVTGNWSFTGGNAKVQLSANQRGWILWPQQPHPTDVITIKYTIDTLPGGAPIGIAATMDFAPATSVGVMCYLGRSPNSAVDGLHTFRFNGTEPDRAVQVPYNLNQTITQRMTRNADVYSCLELSSNMQVGDPYPPMSTNPMFGIFVIGFTVSYHFILIVSRV